MHGPMGVTRWNTKWPLLGSVQVNAAEDHVSMKDHRDNQVTLEDCVGLFSKE